MKRLLLTTLCVIVSVVAMAQGGRTVKGVVLDEKNMPIAGATINVVNSDVSATTEANGTFTLVAPTYATEIEASAEAYISTRLVIDGSYLMFKLKVDKAYAAAKAKAEATKIFPNYFWKGSLRFQFRWCRSASSSISALPASCCARWGAEGGWWTRVRHR